MCLFKFDLGKLLCPTGVLHESQIECSGAERFFDHGGGCVGIFRSAFGVCGNVQVVQSLLIKKGSGYEIDTGGGQPIMSSIPIRGLYLYKGHHSCGALIGCAYFDPSHPRDGAVSSALF